MDLDSLLKADRNCVWHAFSQMAEYDGLVIESGEGCFLTDVHGNRYLDGASSMWCNLFGHRNPKINQAIREQLDRVAHVTNLGMSHPVTIELAVRLVELAPASLKHVFFAGDGASAVEVAMKLAFQYWQQCDKPEPARNKFLALGSAYHGDTIGTVSVSGVSRFQSKFSPLLFDVLRGPCPDSYRLPEHVRPDQACDHYLDCYRNILQAHRDEVAAVVMEPIVQGAAGFVVHPKGFLAGMAKLCREFDVLLIVDEIAVGLGRTGKMFAIEHELREEAPIEPDFLCLGKGLAGGYLAMSATLTSERVWSAFLGSHESSRTFFHGHTFGGNPLAAAAALATLDIFQSERILETTLPERAMNLSEQLRRLARFEIVGDIRQVGMMAAIDLITDRAKRTPLAWSDRRASLVCKHALSQGVWLRPLGNVIPIIPPLSATNAELTQIVHALEFGLEQIAMAPS